MLILESSLVSSGRRDDADNGVFHFKVNSMQETVRPVYYEPFYI